MSSESKGKCLAASLVVALLLHPSATVAGLSENRQAEPTEAIDLSHFSDESSLLSLDPEEERLWYQSKQFRKAIRKGGRLYPSPELNAYVQSVMDKLYPEFSGAIKVHVINSPVLNAFAIPDGNIYINTGLLSRFDNEAQLATVLAHEGAHFVYRHGYRSQRSLKGKTGFATITAILGVPIVGLIGNVLAVSSIYGFSRELETEADNVGFERLRQAGYDVKEASKVFEHLAQETKQSEIDENVFYATHPKLVNRIDNYTKLAAETNVDGIDNTEEYADQVHQLRIDSLEAELSFGRYKHLIAFLSSQHVMDRYSPKVHYYLAEAYRKRNDGNDELNAIQHADKAIELVPDFAPSYRTKGMIMMSQGHNDKAAIAFKKYLELLPNATDKTYISKYIEKLEKSSN